MTTEHDLRSLTTDLLQQHDEKENITTQTAQYHFFQQFKAMMFRRLVLIRRSLTLVLVTFLATIFFTGLAIFAYYLMRSLAKTFVWRMDSKFFSYDDGYIVIAADQERHDHLPYVQHLADIYKKDTGFEPHFLNFSSREEANEYLFEHQKDGNVLFGVSFNSYYPYFNITAMYNESTIWPFNLTSEVIVNRMLWKECVGPENDFTFTINWMLGQIGDLAYSQIGPTILVVGLLSIIPLFVTQPVIDIRGAVRQYMVSCNLSLFPYWLSTFIIDLVIWEVAVVLVWAIFIGFKIQAVLDNKGTLLFLLSSIGPAFVVFSYCLSFTCSSPESASRQLFVVLCVILVIPIIVDFGRMDFVDPVWLDYLWGLVPHLLLQRAFVQIFMRINFIREDLSYYWKDNKNVQGLFIMVFADFPIYVIILWLIEILRVKTEGQSVKSIYKDYVEFFRDEKAKHVVTKEVAEIETMVKRGDRFAVKVEDVCRLFFDTEGSPIAAVNNVTLGVKEGELFGFLGANGAGKTTLLHMITSMVEPSHGTIEIDGVDVSSGNTSHLIAVCPQFNNHLCFEMTPREHFYLYHLLHHYDTETYKDLENHLLSALDLEKFADKPVRELSGGNMRKLAVALAFFSPAKIILLDEPTSSLDPVARRCVHELIMSYHRQRTFMLCTHLLTEAETLCDIISIMVKGCLYTYGTPEYLSQKFGTEFKIDIMLNDDEQSAEKCDQFFQENLPSATLAIERSKARIYSISASQITLPELFDKMSAGKEGANGFSYYTCSSSSLERAFMEIVRMSESSQQL